MKLVTFEDTMKEQAIGAVSQDGMIVPLSPVAPDMISLLARWDDLRSDIEQCLAARQTSIALENVRLLAPVPRPGKIFAIGLNYADHVEETGMDTPANQIWFAKAATAVNGPYDPVQIPRGSIATDYEAEMVAIIGKGGRHISREDAHKHVVGFCVGNDVSERMWQMKTPQFSLAKSFDTHAPFGPWITTCDEIDDPHALGLRCLVNGDLRQSSNTKHLIFDIWDQIAELSQVMTLEPGDVIFTGTPGGVGAAMDPRQFLKAGDIVRCEIDGLGHIEAVFQPE
jgi:2-keto-4-pentenoate hydratase/2-oxohepta-3-ene-1,7-dioic acid hydratase in catechol pathway